MLKYSAISSWLICPSATPIARPYSAIMVVPIITMICCIGGFVSADEEKVQSYTCSGSCSGLTAWFDTLREGLYNKAFESLYGMSADIDPVSGYGVSIMYQCRGDLALSDCPVCFKRAFTLIAQNCSDPSYAHVELPGCGVIYSNQSIQGGNYDMTTLSYNIQNGSTTFSKNVGMAIANVTQQAVENKIKLGTYWAVNVVGGGTTNVCYALAQCHGYLISSDCSYCLSLATDEIKGLGTEYSLGQSSYYRSCYVRYEGFIFYNPDNIPTLLTSLGPSPSSSPSPSVSRTPFSVKLSA